MVAKGEPVFRFTSCSFRGPSAAREPGMTDEQVKISASGYLNCLSAAYEPRLDRSCKSLGWHLTRAG
ncbi:hypothetical protein BRAS3843_2960016 [Bradyrhizobium sp. STM 3843]|nr:hypothetical protein BRAS3843_2960016 [Bradyrhizobium sp. STM 3843]